MSEEVKQGQDAPSNFEERVKDFLIKFEALQKASKVGVRPIISQLGPDFQFVDVEAIEAEKKEEVVAKV